jgi:glycosyltransferase involved in cell wall biosynthesis
VPAMVTDGETGLLTPLDDHAAIAAGVLRLLEDGLLAARLTMRARAQCESYTWAAVRGLWIDAYRSAFQRQTSVETPGIAV